MKPFALMALAAGIVATLAACTMAPKYEQPAAPVPAAYEDAQATATATPADSPAAETGWKEFFPDPELQDLIARALVNNRDLRIATLNVEAARAQYRIQRADLVPTIEAGGTANSPAHARLVDTERRERPHARVFRRVLDVAIRARSVRPGAQPAQCRPRGLLRRRGKSHRRAAVAGLRGRQRLADFDRRSRPAATGLRHARQPAQVLRPDQAALRPGRVRRNRTAPLGIVVARSRSRHRAADATRDLRPQRTRACSSASPCRPKPARRRATWKRRRLARNFPRGCRRNCW